MKPKKGKKKLGTSSPVPMSMLDEHDIPVFEKRPKKVNVLHFLLNIFPKTMDEKCSAKKIQTIVHVREQLRFRI